MKWEEKRKVARLISRLENGDKEAQRELSDIYKETGHAYVIGITGPPGAGKSSMTDKLAKLFLADGLKVAIIAIDPTSPFTGGSILGDRVRMSDLATDPNIFIRSMGTRGHLGGLSASTHLARMVLDAAGADVIFIESVGVGQSEVEIVKVSDTVLMVMVPGLGDDIQSMKAGIMEIGDVFVVNKADLDGADKTVRDVEQMLSFIPPKEWIPPVIKASVYKNEGLEEVKAALEEHREYQKEHNHIKDNTRGMILELLYDTLLQEVKNKGNFDEIITQVVDKKMDPYQAVQLIMEGIK